MNIKPVNFVYRGNRNYVWGADIFSEILNCFSSKSDIQNIRFTINYKISNASCTLEITDNKNEHLKLENVAARCQLQVDGKLNWVGVVERQNTDEEQSVTRREFDESRVESTYLPDKETIILNGNSPFGFLETVVVLNKNLHTNLYPDAPGRWSLTRVDLPKPHSFTSQLSLKLKHNMNLKLTKTEILWNGSKIGDIYFSLV